MEVLNVKQNTEEWMEARSKPDVFTASEAPAMMGVSKFQSRAELLTQKKTGVKKDDSGKEWLHQRGHNAENIRTFIESDVLVDDLLPLTGVLEVEGMKLLASFDGITPDHRLVWENKLWNKVLVENVRHGTLEPLYYWQLEHQLLVSGAEKALFTVTDGTRDRFVSMEYVSIPERREQLIAGWKHFKEDLQSFEVKAKKETVIADTVDKFPSVAWSVNNGIIVSNIRDVVDIVRARAQEEMSVILETDQDFANKDALNKAVKDARERLKVVVSDVRGKFVSYADFEAAAQEIDSILQKMQSQGEKQVKERKEELKEALRINVSNTLAAFLQELNATIHPYDILGIPGAPAKADFIGAAKGKKTLEGIEKALDAELVRVKTELQLFANKIKDNLTLFTTIVDADVARSSFHDLKTLLGQPMEAFAAIVKARIAEYKAAQEKELERQREQIRIEEENRLRREVERKKNTEAMMQGQKDADAVKASGGFEVTRVWVDEAATISEKVMENLPKPSELPMAQQGQSAAPLDAFGIWWQVSGSSMRPDTGEPMSAFARRLAQEAWLAGCLWNTINTHN